jgi:hypothetical protein
MIEFLSLGPNNYQTWLTYEEEYLNDALSLEPSVRLKTWGRERPDYVPNLTATEVVERLYAGGRPDVILIDASHRMSAHPDDVRLFEGLETLSKRCTLLFRTADPWRFLASFKELAAKVTPRIWFVHSARFTQYFNDSLLQGTGGRAYMFPYCFGRRYFNMGLERKFDVGLIGRCQLNGRKLSPWTLRLKGVSVLSEASLSHFRKMLGHDGYLQRYATHVLNLNRCLTAWNSPVSPKNFPDHLHTPFRYVEAPACGAISMTPMDIPELNDYYFPPETYLNCEGRLDRAIEHIKSLRQNPARFLELQQRAYRFVMANHQAVNRVRFILDLLNGKMDADARDYYEIPLSAVAA